MRKGVRGGVSECVACAVTSGIFDVPDEYFLSSSHLSCFDDDSTGSLLQMHCISRLRWSHKHVRAETRSGGKSVGGGSLCEVVFPGAALESILQ